jgi:hypothetical protein
MSCTPLTVDIIDSPIIVELGTDILNSNILSDNINVRLLEGTIKSYTLEEIFQSSIDGFIGSTNSTVLANYFVINEKPIGLINNINHTYILVNTPVVGTVLVFLNGLLQAPGVGLDYTISGSTITFVKAPKTNNDLYVSYIRII